MKKENSSLHLQKCQRKFCWFVFLGINTVCDVTMTSLWLDSATDVFEQQIYTEFKSPLDMIFLCFIAAKVDK